MSIPAAPPFLPSAIPLPFVEPGTGVARVADKTAITTPLDFLLISSRVDFSQSCKGFIEACSRAGVGAEILFVEDLPGQTPGEKLTSLHRMNAGWHANGKVSASTIKIELLHGRVGVAPIDASIDGFRQACLGVEKPELRFGQGSDAAASAPARVHIMTTADGGLAFPTDLFDAALRATVINDGQTSAGFAGTIIYSACGSGVFRETAKKSAGSYVIASGKKSVFTADFNAGLQELIRDQGFRKQQGSAPLSARDCWSLLRNHSGEHVALVGNDTVEINKVLQSGHSEPAIKVRSETGSQEMAQAIRTLFAKIDHGSAKSVQQVIDRWGPGILSADHDAVMPGMSLWSVALESSRDSEQKFRLLLSHAPNYFPPQSTLVTWLNIATKRSWIALLGDIFKRMTDMTSPPMSLEHMVIWMRSNPKLTDSLIKCCKRSREVNESVGTYLYKAQLAEPSLNRLVQSNLTLPPDFDRLAKKAAERFSAQATH